MSNIAAKRAADDDLDSPMQEDSSAASSPATPPNAAPPTHFTSELSPPDSQQLAAQNPASAPSPFTPLEAATGSKATANTSKKMPPSDKVNANGKRNWELNAGGNASNGGQAAQLEKIGKDDASGYTWEREEDAPGWQWGNPKAREEAQRAWAGVFGKDRSVGNKYGDVLLNATEQYKHEKVDRNPIFGSAGITSEKRKSFDEDQAHDKSSPTEELRKTFEKKTRLQSIKRRSSSCRPL